MAALADGVYVITIAARRCSRASVMAASPLISSAEAFRASIACQRISSVGLKQIRRAKAELLINNLGAALASVLHAASPFFLSAGVSPPGAPPTSSCTVTIRVAREPGDGTSSDWFIAELTHRQAR
jgi:hypothetical protein